MHKLCIILALTSLVLVSGCVAGLLPIGVLTGIGLGLNNKEDDNTAQNTAPDPVKPPDLMSLSPDNGDVSGGTLVTLTGTDFQAGVTVTFDGVTPTGVTFVSTTIITCVTLAHPAGVVDVCVANQDGQNDTLIGAFTYVVPIPGPNIISMLPITGPTTGGTDVTISGTDFQSSAIVTFGGINASSIIVSATTITCVTPVHAAGIVDVVVQNPDLQSDVLINGFTFWPISWESTTNPSVYADTYKTVDSDSSNLFVVGYDAAQGNGNTQFRIEKRSLLDGSLSSAFGAGGVVSSDPSTTVDSAYAVVHDSTSLFVAGMDNYNGNHQWRIEKRDIIDGSLVTGFGTNGVSLSNPSSYSDVIFAMVIDSSGLYSVGYDSINGLGSYQWRIEKRNSSDGSLITAFGTNGVVISNPSTLGDVPYAAAIDSSSIYIVGFDRSAGTNNDQWRIEKRNKTNGTLIAGFGANGVITDNPSSVPDVAYSIAIDNTFMYVVGYDTTPGNSQWRIEKRDLTTGALVTAFGTNGIITSNLSSGVDIAYSVVVDGSSMYVAGSDSTSGNEQWRIEKRDVTTGSLISSFGTGGVYTSNFSSGGDVINAILVNGLKLYAAGYDSIPSDAQMRVQMILK